MSPHWILHMPDVAERVIEKIKEAQITVVAVPDLYRVGRNDVRHVRRGLTRIKELLTAGVNVTYASNNVRDCLRPMGNMDILEETRSLIDGAHMDTVEHLYQLMNMITYNAAKGIGIRDYGLERGCRADLVVLRASSIPAAVIGKTEKTYVFKSGRLMAANRTVSESIQWRWNLISFWWDVSPAKKEESMAEESGFDERNLTIEENSDIHGK